MERSDLDPNELPELAALADGTLDPTRRVAVEQRIAASHELTEQFERERRTVEMLRQIAVPARAPARLRERVEAERARPGSLIRRRPIYATGIALTLAVAVLALVLALPSGTPGALSVPEAAALALRGSASAAPGLDPRAPETRLTQNVERVHFPNWSTALSWVAVGQRIDHLAGRRVVTVYYQGHETTVAYTIVAGPPLAQPTGTITYRGGQELSTLSVAGRLVVTWRRGGHTCVLSGMGVTQGELDRLALWGYQH